jgi:hypothetical protein
MLILINSILEYTYNIGNTQGTMYNTVQFRLTESEPAKGLEFEDGTMVVK